MKSPEITLSFNEIMFFFSRAAMGVGLPYGLSEDFGRISVWIAASGLDPAAITSNALKSIDEAQSSLCSSQTENDTETILKPSDEKQLSALMAGPTVCDWISTKDTEITEYKNYCTKNIDYPFLIAAAVGALNMIFSGISDFFLISIHDLKLLLRHLHVSKTLDLYKSFIGLKPPAISP